MSNERLPHITTDKIFSRKDIDEVYAKTREMALKEVMSWLIKKRTWELDTRKDHTLYWLSLKDIEALKQGEMPE